MSENKEIDPYMLEKERKKAIDKQMKIYVKSGQYDVYQLAEIREGLENNLDVSMYDDPHFHFDQMREIRLGLISKVKVSIYAVPSMHYSKMRAIRIGLEHHFNMRRYLKRYDGLQIMQIVNGMIDGVDISWYDDPDFSAQQMAEIHAGLKKGIDVSSFAKVEIPAVQMQKTRIMLYENYVEEYRFKAKQQQEEKERIRQEREEEERIQKIQQNIADNKNRIRREKNRMRKNMMSSGNNNKNTE